MKKIQIAFMAMLAVSLTVSAQRIPLRIMSQTPVYTLDGNRFWFGLQPYGLVLYDRLSDRVAYNNRIPGMAQYLLHPGNGRRAFHETLQEGVRRLTQRVSDKRGLNRPSVR